MNSVGALRQDTFSDSPSQLHQAASITITLQVDGQDYKNMNYFAHFQKRGKNVNY